jgi:hypothetical protein
LGGQNKGRIDGSCGTYGRIMKYTVFVGKPEGKRTLPRPKHEWEDSIYIDLTRTVLHGVRSLLRSTYRTDLGNNRQDT